MYINFLYNSISLKLNAYFKPISKVTNLSLPYEIESSIAYVYCKCVFRNILEILCKINAIIDIITSKFSCKS